MTSPNRRRFHPPSPSPAHALAPPWLNSSTPYNDFPVNRFRKNQKQPPQQRFNHHMRPWEFGTGDYRQRVDSSMLQGAREKQCLFIGGRSMVRSRDQGNTMSCDELVFESGASSRCNLDSFLECTMPTLKCKYMPKSFVRGARQPFEREGVPFYTLGDLWDSFDEWSAYGAGVPINLPSGETVVQYYVPYLSALQIYEHNTVFCEKRRLGDDSDLSDAELRETSSEASTDTELDKLLSSDPHKFCGGRPKSLQADDWKACTRFEYSDGFSSEECCGQEGDRAHLIFEFFEQSAPYGRAPLSDKIAELAAEFPKLKHLRSIELSSASWVSVAWYPIYRIPTGPTLRNLAACFLTFHSLSMPLQGKEVNGKEAARGMGEGKVELRAFGLASYKLRRGKMTEKKVEGGRQRQGGQDCKDEEDDDDEDEQGRRVKSLHHSADSWLKRYKIRHPDFDFFTSHSC